MTPRLRQGMSKRQITEDARALDGIIKYMLQQSPITIRDLVVNNPRLKSWACEMASA